MKTELIHEQREQLKSVQNTVQTEMIEGISPQLTAQISRDQLSTPSTYIPGPVLNSKHNYPGTSPQLQAQMSRDQSSTPSTNILGPARNSKHKYPRTSPQLPAQKFLSMSPELLKVMNDVVMSTRSQWSGCVANKDRYWQVHIIVQITILFAFHSSSFLPTVTNSSNQGQILCLFYSKFSHFI